MPEIKVNVGDPKSGKTVTFTIPEEDGKQFYGKKIGDAFKGELIGRAGYELEITGGSDRAGFPMRRDVNSTGRHKLLITKSTGNQQTEKGVRIRKTVAGNTVYEETSQINAKVVKAGKAPLVEEPAAPAEEQAEGSAAEENPAEK